ncbi:MAG TPA: isochorismatase family cysteine hydrolase [Acidimicrobiia bacterium]
MHDPFYDFYPKREPVPLVSGEIALITIDLQYLDAHPKGWVGRIADADGRPELLDQRWEGIEGILPNVRRVQDAFRKVGEEVMHVRVAYRTKDGRDSGTGFLPSTDVDPLPRDDQDDDFLPEVAPVGDEVVFNKTTSSVFNSSGVDKVLQRMGIRHLLVTGIVTDGCVELSARDAADRGYAVTLVQDGCSATTPEAHKDALERMNDGGFIALKTSDQVVEEVLSIA